MNYVLFFSFFFWTLRRVAMQYNNSSRKLMFIYQNLSIWNEVNSKPLRKLMSSDEIYPGFPFHTIIEDVIIKPWEFLWTAKSISCHVCPSFYNQIPSQLLHWLTLMTETLSFSLSNDTLGTITLLPHPMRNSNFENNLKKVRLTCSIFSAIWIYEWITLY